ncbi:serine protease [Ramlibacter ginsenosidimutans]|uniref:Serine protease n=1 Tax=Ramlibacter ginsenosidimutans TaxID=502333 RepID=A0A934WQM4_9BURK|nr:S1C family serine protease [Ramlibacter ginsenosidimutans]MBK6009410.1 serine protease [Ramlibacter ginsenosidimutans]
MTSVPSETFSVADAVERVAPSVAGVRARRLGTSSAFCWRPGVLVTAASAVGHADRVQVVLADGSAVAGSVRGIDPGTDLAVVSAEGDWPVVERRLDPPARVGDFVFAVGRDAAGMVHASFGRIGAVAGGWRSWRGASLDRYVRLDGGLYPGHMGAPVCDAQGQVLGLASAALARHHGIVVPAATIDKVVDALLAHGRVRRGHLGIAAQSVPLSPAMRTAADVDSDTGLLVAGVGEGSAAARAGMLVGDVLVSVGGRPVSSIEALRDLLTGDQIGSRLRVVLLRGGARQELSVEVDEKRWQGRC